MSDDNEIDYVQKSPTKTTQNSQDKPKLKKEQVEQRVRNIYGEVQDLMVKNQDLQN